MEHLGETNEDAVRLLKRAVSVQDWTLCRELFHFLRSIDESGDVLAGALEQLADEEHVEGASIALESSAAS